MREIVHIQAGQCGNQIGTKVIFLTYENHMSFSCYIGAVNLGCDISEIYVLGMGYITLEAKLKLR